MAGIGGVEMMLKAMGIDPKVIVGDFTKLKDGVVETLTALDFKISQIHSAQKFQMGDESWNQAQQKYGTQHPPQPQQQNQPQLVRTMQPTSQK